MKAVTPTGPSWTVDHDAVAAELPLGELAGCVQDPIHHAEGDVAIHTRMVLDELVKIPAWRALDEAGRETVFLAAALHDIGKPATTKIEEAGGPEPGAPGGADVLRRVTSRGHSRVGALMARAFLYRAGFDPVRREQIASLIHGHQLPFFLIERPDPKRVAHQISQVLVCSHLALVAEADIRGRVCRDLPRILDQIALFVELCREAGCLDGPKTFANDHSRVEYFRKPGRDADYAAFDDTKLEVTMLSGLPGSGKDTWVARHAGDRPVISLDGIRDEMDLEHGETPGQVIAAAKERAKEHLRAKRPFVLNATNISREIRGRWLDLFHEYGARVRIVMLETPWAELQRRNKKREHPVPPTVLDRLVEKWEPPDPTEAHVLERVS